MAQEKLNFGRAVTHPATFVFGGASFVSDGQAFVCGGSLAIVTHLF